MRTSTIRRASLALTATAALGAAAMTGFAATSQSTTPSATRTVTAPAGEKLRYSAARLKAPPGRVTLRMINRDDIAHNIAVRGPKLAKARVGKIVGMGGVSKVTATLPAGRYTYYCSVFGHESSGMRGTLTVKR
jgi:plastocyanin